MKFLMIKFEVHGFNFNDKVELPEFWDSYSATEQENFLNKAKELSILRNVQYLGVDEKYLDGPFKYGELGNYAESPSPFLDFSAGN